MRKDRVSPGGGVLIYLKEDLTVHPAHTWDRVGRLLNDHVAVSTGQVYLLSGKMSVSTQQVSASTGQVTVSAAY